MPVPLPERISWVESTVVDEYTRPIAARPWIRENLYKPLDGFKTWRRGDRLCAKHADLVGEIQPRRRDCYAAPHAGCDGLRGEKVILVVVDVTRQEGKTTGAATYILSELVLGRNSNALYMAAAEGQSERVFDQKFLASIRHSPPMKEALEIGTHEIRNTRRGNSFVYVPTSKSVPGGSYRLLVIDEARDIDADIFFRLLPSILAAKGLECTAGHVTLPMPAEEPAEDWTPPPCPACGRELDEWYGRALVMSSAGDDSAWFTELVEHLAESPDAAFHLFSSTARLNANKSTSSVDALERVFGELSSMRGLVQRELRNVPGRAGDEFLPRAKIKALVNKRLMNADTSEAKAIAFLDCSRTTDLTSLVVVTDVPVKNGAHPLPAFTKLATARIDVWDPTDKGQCPSGRVRYRPGREDAPGGTIQEHLEELIPRFPGLVELWIDTTLLSEAKDLYTWARGRPWAGKVRAYAGSELESALMWDALESRALTGPASLEIQEHPRLIQELARASVKRNERGTVKVMDSAKGNRRGGKRRHRDISMALAGCCWAAAKFLVRGVAGGAIADRLNASRAIASRFRPITSTLQTERF